MDCGGKKYARKKCPHGKARNGYRCKECGGKGLCKHGRDRSRCKECGGKKQVRKRCPHGKALNGYFCKECGGKGLCKHDRRRDQCVDRGKKRAPRPRCPHGKAKNGYYCKECGGKGLCKHGRQHLKCDDCACPICLKGMAPSNWTVLPCGHNLVCCKCWVQIAETQAAKGLDAACPMCRAVVIAAVAV